MSDTPCVPGEKEGTAAMIALVSAMIVCLVANPSEVAVRAVTTGERTCLQVKVAPEDTGKIVGKQGRTARSLRTIISAIGMNRKQFFSLDIIEDRACVDQRI